MRLDGGRQKEPFQHKTLRPTKFSKTRKRISGEQRPRLCGSSRPAQPGGPRDLASTGRGLVKTQQRPCGHANRDGEGQDPQACSLTLSVLIGTPGLWGLLPGRLLLGLLQQGLAIETCPPHVLGAGTPRSRRPTSTVKMVPRWQGLEPRPHVEGGTREPRGASTPGDPAGREGQEGLTSQPPTS